MELFSRESSTCTTCGSTPRFRSIIQLLSRELFGESLALPDSPRDKKIRGIELSDWSGYAAPLVDSAPGCVLLADESTEADCCSPHNVANSNAMPRSECQFRL